MGAQDHLRATVSSFWSFHGFWMLLGSVLTSCLRFKVSWDLEAYPGFFGRCDGAGQQGSEMQIVCVRLSNEPQLVLRYTNFESSKEKC
jgi:hypothetical protein